MPTLNGKYNIKAVSNIIGVQPSTLRAWERRYQIIAPKRNQAGHRLYTEEHIQILKWLMEKVSSGMMIGQAVRLLEENRLQSTVQKEIHFDKEVVLVDDLLQALLKFDEITIAALLNEAFSIYSTEKVVASIVLRVTDKLLTSKIIMRFQWCNFNMHYHFTNASRDGVSQCLNVFLFTQSYCVRKGCIERIYFSTYLRLKGYEAIYIRTSLAEDGMLSAVEEIQPKYVFVSFADEQEMKKTMNFINLLQEKGNLF